MSLLVYRSSAGSGKTFTLAKDYVILLLKNPANFRHILAITFTNKAAHEMKERILKNLRLLSSPAVEKNKERDSLVQIINNELGNALSGDEIRTRASIALQNILHHYTEFAISTIDSFMHRVVRSFAFDLQLSHNFEVELDQSVLLDKAIDLLIQKAGNDDALTAIMLAYIDHRVNDESSFQLRSDLHSHSNIFFSEEGVINFPKIGKISNQDWFKIKKDIEVYCSDFESKLKAEATMAIQLIEQSRLEPSNLMQGKRGIYSYFERFTQGDFTRLSPNSYVLKTVEEEVWYSKMAEVYVIEKIEEIKPRLYQYYREIERLINVDNGRYTLFGIIVKTIFVTALLKEVFLCLKEVKKEYNVIHISEFNKRISEVVLSEPVPFIYARLGEKYRSFLLDEFQDTSISQWHNLIPLVSESLSNSEGDAYSLIVGDGKQSVYRWRSGEAAQFEALPQIYQMPDKPAFIDAQVAFINETEFRELDKNWRSGKNIVDFNNRFFRQAASRLDPESMNVYSDLEQVAAKPEKPSRVEVRFLGDDDIENVQLEEIYEVISSLLQQSYVLADIAVLIRKKQQAEIIADFLMSKGIRVVSAESMKITASASVRFIVALLQSMNEPHLQIPAAHSAIFLHSKSTSGFEDIHSVLTDIAKSGAIALWKRCPGLDVHKISVLPLFEICERLCRYFGLYVSYDVYIQYFMDAVLKYSSMDNAGIQGFLVWWKDNAEKLSLDLPESTDAVKIMTIHKSKGLAFKVVLCPYAWETRNPSKNYMWFDTQDMLPFLPRVYLNRTKALEQTPLLPQIESEVRKTKLDKLNLQYVAYTRAEERLYLFSKIPGNNEEHTENVIHSILHTEFDMSPDEACYVYGDVEIKPEVVNAVPEFEIKTCKSNDWTENLQISAREELPENSVHREFGNVIHDTLARISQWCSPEQAINSACLLFPVHADAIRKTLNNLMSDQDVLRFFNPQNNTYSEFEMVDEDKRILRPDRIVLYDNYAEVIDFKTGKPTESHSEQIERYACLLKKIIDKPVHKYLLYVTSESHKLEKLA